MRKYFVAVALLFCLGCSAGMERMETLMKDPHYQKHQQALDDLEHVYLQKQISYAEYDEKKKELEDTYAKEVQQREQKIHE